jgi:hypothetical protein
VGTPPHLDAESVARVREYLGRREPAVRLEEWPYAVELLPLLPT